MTVPAAEASRANAVPRFGRHGLEAFQRTDAGGQLQDPEHLAVDRGFGDLA
jgi:hypothetical protein